MTEPDDIIVRPLSLADVDELSRFIEPFVREGRLLPRTQDELEDLVPNGFVAIAEGRIVGVAALEVYSKKLAELRSLAVAPEYRRMGVGRALVQKCVERATQLNVLEVMAVTSSEEFFKSCGFDFTLPGEKKALFIQTRDVP
jgi:N-acetylglutamate synthase-like GNAT family acetyltransferase